MLIEKNKNDFIRVTVGFISNIVLYLSLIIFCVMLFVTEKSIAYDKISLLVLVSSMSQLLVLCCNKRVRKISLAFVLYLYNLICHNGFIIAYYFDPKYINFKSSTSMSFMNVYTFYDAIFISNIVLIIFTIGINYYANHSRNAENAGSEGNEAQVSEKAYAGKNIIDTIGTIALGLSGLYMTYVIVPRGLWAYSYVDVREIMTGFPFFAHTVIISSLALAFAVVGGTIKGIKRNVTIFAYISLLHFLIGNRGEVLYSAVTCLALYQLRFKNIKKRSVIIVALCSIIIIPAVRLSREMRIDEYSFNILDSFLDVLCEEGMQIMPFTYIVEYVQNGHSYMWGGTYLYYFGDFILRRFGFVLQVDQAYVIKQIMPKVGLGFSMIAEVYYNFTIVGASVLYFLYAKLLLNFEQKLYVNKLSAPKRLFMAMLVVEFVNLTRNDASTLPVYLMYSVIFLLAYWAFSKGK